MFSDKVPPAFVWKSFQTSWHCGFMATTQFRTDTQVPFSQKPQMQVHQSEGVGVGEHKRSSSPLFAFNRVKHLFFDPMRPKRERAPLGRNIGLDPPGLQPNRQCPGLGPARRRRSLRGAERETRKPQLACFLTPLGVLLLGSTSTAPINLFRVLCGSLCHCSMHQFARAFRGREP